MKSKKQQSNIHRRHCAMSLSMFLFLVFFSVSSRLNSITWEINQDGSGDFTTIQAGIDTSANSDTVLVYQGTYYENLNMNEKNITLASLELTTGNAEYINSTIIDGQRLLSCIEIQDITLGATIRGFTIQNGYGTEIQGSVGGGIFVQCAENIDITNCNFYDNVANLGGAILTILSDLDLAGLRIIHNSASLGGGVYALSDNTIVFNSENRCNIYNNNAGKGADLYSEDSGHINVIVDTFSVFNPSRYFAEYLEGSTYSFNIQHNWMELEPNDLYVAMDGDDNNSGLTPDEPLNNISWAVRKIQADEQNPRTVHVAEGIYAHQVNEQIFPIGCKEYVSIIGEDMDETILFNDYSPGSIRGNYLNGNVEISNFTIQHDPGRLTASVMLFFDIEFIKLSNIKIQNNTNINGILKVGYSVIDYDNIIIKNNIVEGLNSGMFFSNVAGSMKNCIWKNNENIQPEPYSNEIALQLLAYDDVVLENCVFSGNSSINSEGRIIRTTNHNTTEPTITFNNCLISDNTIGSDHIFESFNFDGLTEFNNCTFANNTTMNNWFSSTIYSKSDINMTNTIMHNNTEYEIFMADDTINGHNYVLNLDHCNIKNGEDGIYNQIGSNTINWLEGNIEDDPLFAGIGDHPYQLTEESPCVDAGVQDTTGLYLPPWDLLGNYRIWDGDGNGSEIIDMSCYEFDADEYPVGITNDELPFTDYKLTNYPNPFNPQTRIVFEIPQAGNIKLEIFNIKGQKVKTLIDCYMNQGGGETIWNGRDESGKRVSSGVYLYQLSTPSKIITKKCMLLK